MIYVNICNKKSYFVKVFPKNADIDNTDREILERIKRIC